MFNTRSVLALVMSLSLLGGTPAVLADPGNGKGNPHGNQMDGGKADKGNKGNQGGPGNKGGGAGQKGNGGGNWDSGPRIDVGGVRVILGDNRGYWNPGPALPPGIQKNLARGKPLPPGIAKNSTAACWAGCRTTTATSGCRPAPTCCWWRWRPG